MKFGKFNLKKLPFFKEAKLGFQILVISLISAAIITVLAGSLTFLGVTGSLISLINGDVSQYQPEAVFNPIAWLVFVALLYVSLVIKGLLWRATKKVFKTTGL